MRERRDRREIILGHADHLVRLAIGENLHPVIFQQLETDFAFGQQPHELEKFFRGDGSGAFFFHFGFAGGADGKLEIGGRQRDVIAGGFAQDVAENRNRGFPLDDSLRQAELLEQVKLLHAEFHRWISSAGRRKHNCYCEGLLYPVLKYV